MIAAVATVRNEADIIEQSVRHLLAEGIDRVYIADASDGDDGTTQILSEINHVGRVVIFPDTERHHLQPRWIDSLAHVAAKEMRFGPKDWILPFDADEFPTSCWLEETIAETLATRVPDDVRVIEMPMFQQRNWREASNVPKPLPKVAYRWHPKARIGPGNHTVDYPDDNLKRMRPIIIREIQYRGFEHYRAKVADRCRTMDPELLAKVPTAGIHHLKLKDASDEELREEWEKIDSGPWHWDPIPHASPLYDDLKTGKTLKELFDERAPGGPMWSDVKSHIPRFVELVHETDAMYVIELGVNTGVSTIAFLKAMQDADFGHLWSCDIADPRIPQEVRDCRWWHLHIGNDMEWKCPEGNLDLLYIDTSHTYGHTLAELKKFAPLVKQGGAIALHDCEGYPDQTRAVRHWEHWWEEQGRKVTRQEWHSHDNGLQVLWV